MDRAIRKIAFRSAGIAVSLTIDHVVDALLVHSI
jgi:hypothetical protein